MITGLPAYLLVFGPLCLFILQCLFVTWFWWTNKKWREKNCSGRLFG